MRLVVENLHRRDQAMNLFAFSPSTLPTIPISMTMDQPAGRAAAMAIGGNLPVQDVAQPGRPQGAAFTGRNP
ncbi:MAG: hypothetical protein HYZ57_07770 [Acidobacteria bacterium]|nr:hypothetical protein [Acidobacteriota bacterium]